MAILLHVLGIIGKILLILLCVLLVLLILLLLVPFRYRADIRKHGDAVGVHARVSWLFRAIWFRFDFIHEGKNTKTSDLRVFGIPVLKLITGRKSGKGRAKTRKQRGGTAGKRKTGTDEASKQETAEKKSAFAQGEGKENSAPAKLEPGKKTHTEEEAERRMREGAKKKPTVRPGERAEKAQGGPEVRVFHRRQPGLAERLSARIMAFAGKVKRAVKKIFSNLTEACGKIRQWNTYLHSEQFRDAFRVIKDQGIPLLRHVLPRKAEGTVEFGMEDPADTGELLGAAAMFFALIPEDLRIVPDFTQRKLEADVTLRGHMILLPVLVRTLRIFLNKNVKTLIRVIRKKNPDAASEHKSSGQDQKRNSNRED